ncbi:MAG: alanine--tRNA ligase, partial [Pseudomonadota bacterium]
IADHIRSTAFLIVDGVRPSNEGRSYILRRIIRRAIRHGHKLGLTDTFFYRLVHPLADVMAAAYPLLSREKNVIEQVIQQEEQQFARTLTQGMAILEQGLAKLSDKIIPGELAFTLYDTYGFPVDLTADIAREHGLTIDYDTLEQKMTQQRQQSREAGQFKPQAGNTLAIQGNSQFLGYQYLQHDGVITDLLINEQAVKKLETGNKGIIVLDQTPFYAESGGQVGDRGNIESEHGVFVVEDTQKQGAAILHIGHVRSGYFAIDDKVNAQVDHANRQAIVLNHSATHLLHAALRQQLGKHVVQRGSLVAADYLRFDFSHPQPLTDKELTDIEKRVNDNIRLNHMAITEEMSPAQAQQAGAMALFGEKYGDKVRVLSMGDFSKELCGGTHVKNTGDIGLLKITNETGIASGIRRIEAVTGEKALDWLDKQKEDFLNEITTLKEKSKQQNKELKQLQQQLHQQQSSNLTDQAKEIDGIKVLAVRIKTASSDVLRATLDQLKNKLGRAIIVLASENGEKINLIAGVSKDLIPPFHAGKLVNMVAAQVGGKGGGRPDMAQAGGNQPQHLDKALDSVYTWVAEQKTS